MGNVTAHNGSRAIQLRGLQKTYGEDPVLWDLDLDVDWGELLVIFGANGAGKTTLLKVLSTQARPDAGEVRVAGVDRSRRPGDIRRLVGMVAHRPLLYEELTCQENLLFYGRMYGLKGVRRRVQEVLEMVGLEARSNHKVHTLSHGMQKRLSIGRAVLHQPPVLLMDEPESGLDQEAQVVVGRLLAEWKEQGRTVLMTTHNLERGLAWGDRVAILAGGKIAYEEARLTLDPVGFGGTYRQYVEAAP